MDYVGLGMNRGWKKIEIYKKVLYMNFWTTCLRGKPRNRWQGDWREGGRLVGGEKYITISNEKRTWERQETIAYSTCQWMNLKICFAFVMTLQNCEMLQLDSSCPCISLSVPSQWTTYLGTFVDVSKISLVYIYIPLQSDNNSQCFTPDRGARWHSG